MGKKEHEEQMKYNYNEGRLSADQKWTKAIDERIAELEIQVGIPELRRLRERVRYRWDNYDEEDKPKKVAFIRSRGIERRKPRCKISPSYSNKEKSENKCKTDNIQNSATDAA
jgi:hypothetical protein